MVQASAFYGWKLFEFTHDKYPDGDRGMIFFPAWIFGSQDVKGLVLMAHGELSLGYDKPYQYSMSHIGSFLAMLGFVCISIQPRPALGTSSHSAGTDDTFLRHLEYVNGVFGNQYYIKGKPLALIGHSQAGKSIISAAIHIKKNKTAGYQKVDAVVSLAGTRPDVDGLTDAYLGMQGSLDEDIPGVLRTVEAYEDLTFARERYFLWMHGCNHRQYTKKPSMYDGVSYYLDGGLAGVPGVKPPVGLVLAKTQNIVAAQYVAMFLLWKLASQAQYRAVFTGDEYVKFTSADANVQADFNDRLRVFPRSDRWRQRNLGGLPNAVSFQGMLQDGKLITSDTNPATFDSLSGLEVTCVGHTLSGFVVGWDLAKFSQSRMLVKCEPAVMSLAIKAIEFHAVIIADPDTLTPQDPVKARAYLWYGPGPDFKISNMVDVFIDPPWSGLHRSSILGTIRIPVAMFGLDDSQLATATKFLLDFSKADRVRGRVAVTGFRAVLE